MSEIDIDEIIKSLTVVNEKRQYWFVRTLSGFFYDIFVSRHYIGIGYNEISVADIAKANTGNDVGKGILEEIIKKTYPEEKRPNYIGNQLIDFAYNIKKGDVVIIPSHSTAKISIGEVTETPVFEATATDLLDECPFEKRKRIKWLKTDIWFDSLDPQLIFLKYTHRSVTKIDTYTASFVDRIISPLYIKDKDAHLSIEIRQQEPIKAFDLFETWLEIFNLTESISRDIGFEVKRESFDTRINVQSPGTIEFISYAIEGIVVLSIIVAAFIGAEISLDSEKPKLKFKIKCDGLIKVITDRLNNKTDRKLKETLIQKIDQMNIDPKELIKILEQVNKKK